MALTNEQLLLLDNLIYSNSVDTNLAEGTTVLEIVEDLMKSASESDGAAAMSADEWREIAQIIKNDTVLSSYKITNIKNADGSKVACFVDDIQNPTDVNVIFRGTGSAYEWHDNGTGGYLSDTVKQEKAAEYINSLDARYGNNITVSGHSKGGNTAQYVTITTDRVGRCTSFDGQGFSNEFLEKYQTRISERANRITSISASKDYVNCLFYPIAGTLIYIDGRDQGAELWNYHKPNIVFDDNGKFRPETVQSEITKQINDYSKYIITHIREPERSLILDGAMAIAENFLAHEKSEESPLQMLYSLYQIVTQVDDFIQHQMLKKIIDTLVKLVPVDYFRVNLNCLQSDTDNIKYLVVQIINDTKSIYDEVYTLTNMWKGSAGSAFLQSFSHQYEQISEYLEKINGYVNEIDYACDEYARCEQSVFGLIESIHI